ncbi:MCE family protein [Mycolicibacterium komossense]|uniref:MCE family protein n=2 Tax=Mycolicibacterium komossense TaxID=1779 RepID=A0ABT3CHQ6_9MYCO|nr:MCE family protein [Mycolicibacterium komossense]
MRAPLVLGSCVAVLVSGCSFSGLNTLPLPGAVGRGSDAQTYHVEIANVAQLESNSPVMISDVVVGSVGKMTVDQWHADVEVLLKPDVVVPANAVASVGQTSLLGSMHLALNPPIGQAAEGRLQPGATIPLSDSSTYPTTEQTLSSLAAVVNGGGLGQISDIIHNFSTALNGREPQVRDLLTRLDTFVGTLNAQRDNINATITGLNRLAATFAGDKDVIATALKKVPPALAVLVKEQPRITTALEKLGTFSDTATRLVNDTQGDLVKNLQNLGPTIKELADIGPDLDFLLAYAFTFPYTQSFVDRAVHGDYLNLFAVIDATIPRLKRGLFLGTRWGENNAALVPAPGDPWYQTYTYDPLSVGVAPPPAAGSPGAPVDESPLPMAMPPAPPDVGPILPVVPRETMLGQTPAPPVTNTGIFAGPYNGNSAPQAPPADAPPVNGGN